MIKRTFDWIKHICLAIIVIFCWGIIGEDDDNTIQEK